MPSSIPYDPSLVLANIVSKEALDLVVKIAEAQAPSDAASEALNSLVSSRRSLDMTNTELKNLGIDTDDLDKEIKSLNKRITKAAVDYAKAKIKTEEDVAPLRSQIGLVAETAESPVDYVRTQIKSMPLASDSLNMDVQYFSMDTSVNGGIAFASTIAGYVALSTSWMGIKSSTEISQAAGKQVSQQVSKHSIAGTLVLSVSCTHKNAHVLAPLILNVDKGISAYNHLHPQAAFDPTDREAMAGIAAHDEDPSEPKLTILSGTTYGSSFVGMVHVLNTTDTKASQSLTSVATSLQAQMDAGAWFEGNSGGFGVNTAFSNEVKDLLSRQSITSHVTLICMGVIPSIVANDVKLGVEQFAKFDPQGSMEAIAAIQNATTGEQATVQSAAAAARTGNQMVAIKSGEIKAALSALGEIQDGANKILDINSMMSALDDYLKKAAEGSGGVPLNYYLKDITKKMLAELWVEKYYPDKKYIAIKEDDSGDKDDNPHEGNNDSNGASDDPAPENGEENNNDS